MKITNNNSSVHPKKLSLNDGTTITTIRQSKTSTSWMRSHGCSLIAECYALQWLGIKTTDLDALLKAHKKYTPNYIPNKVRIIALPTVINKIAGNRGSSKYYKTPTSERIKSALNDGCLVIFEQRTKSSGNIHTVTFVRDGGKNYIINSGTASTFSVDKKMSEELCTNSKYKGMIVVKRANKDGTTTISYNDDTDEEEVLTFKKVTDFNSKSHAVGDNPYYHSPKNPYEYYNSSRGSYGNCTWTAYGRFIEVWGNAPKSEQKAHPMKGWFAGNAYNWVTSAKSLGYKTGTTPKLGAIICWGYYGNPNGDPGHVAFVEDINYDKKGKVTSIEISQSGWSAGDMKNQILKPGSGHGTNTWNFGYNNPYFNGFIYNPIEFGKSGSSGSSVSDDEEVTGTGIDFQNRASKLISSDNYSFIAQEQEEEKEKPKSATTEFVEKFKDLFSQKQQQEVVDTINNLAVSLTSLLSDLAFTANSIVTQALTPRIVRKVNSKLSITGSVVEAPFIEINLGGYKIGSYGGNLDEFPNYVNSLSVSRQNGVINQYRIQLIHQIRTGEDPNMLDELFSNIGYNMISIKYGDANSGGYFQDNKAMITNVSMNRNYSSMNISYELEATSEGSLIQTYVTTFPEVTDQPSNVLRHVIYDMGEVSRIIQDAFPGMKNRVAVESNNLIPSNDAVVHLEKQVNVNVIDYMNYLVGNMSNKIVEVKDNIVETAIDVKNAIGNKINTVTDRIMDKFGNVVEAVSGGSVTEGVVDVDVDRIVDQSERFLRTAIGETSNVIKYKVNNTIKEEKNDVIRNSTYYITYNDSSATSPVNGSYINVKEVKADVSPYSVTSRVYELTVGYPDDLIFDFTVESTNSWELLYKNNEKFQEYYYTIQDNGDIDKYYSPTLNSSYNVMNELSKNWWTQMVKFPISASLTIKGLLKPVMLMEYIKINVVFYGQQHITSGIYVITGQTDELSGSGFRTTLSLVRVGNE